MELLTQTQVLKELNRYTAKTITKQAFYDRVKKGQIPVHYKPNSKRKFYKLREVAKVYNIRLNDIEKATPSDIKEDKSLYTPENIAELNRFLEDADSPMVKVQIIDTFWAGKIKETKYKEQVRELIKKDEALYVMQVAVSNFKTKMYEIPHLIKARFPDSSVELIDELHRMIDTAFDEFTKTKL